MSRAKELVGAATRVLATATAVDNNTTPVVFDFGTPNDIYLPTVNSSAKQSGDRLALVLIARRTSGTTSTCTFTVSDAPDSSGSIGTPATALTDSSSGLATTATTDLITVVGVRVQTGRPWLRVGFNLDDGTDVFTCQAILLAIPGGL